ncbi:lactonase family protein [Streptomyces sp. NPDC050610]|uniref:lactonase family protein n=1 Tax=Streptomyces sp. NPDC050610 TaxID=3157097 RepID=UPI003433661B
MGAEVEMGRRRLLGAVAAGAVAGAVASGGTARAARPADLAAAAERGRGGGASGRPCYLGTYTSGGSGGRGIGFAAYDGDTGRLTSTRVLEGVADPSFLALDPSGRTLYAVDEQDEGGVSAVRLSADGGARLLGRQPTGGAAPCHLSLHPGGRHLLSANYGSGSVAVHPIGRDGAVGARTDLVRHTGSGPDPERQRGPHAHQVLTAPDGRYILAVDLGTDAVHTYRLDESTGRLRHISRAATRPGAGPRHLTFHPSGRFAYLANELDDTVVACRYDPAAGRLTPGAPQPATVPGPGGGVRNYPSQVLVTGDGRFAFLANRGRDCLTRYAVRDGGARLELLDAVPVGGAYPRHIAFSPSGSLLFAANQNSDSVTVFAVDRRSGQLALTGGKFTAPTPVCTVPA